MKIGVVLPHRGRYASARSIASFAKDAEELGYDSLWVTDHIFMPSRLLQIRGDTFYESLCTLSYVSAITQKVGLGTCVLAVPARNLVLLAKQIATIDALSGGRFIAGLGTGWIEEELASAGVPWKKRGAVLDEAIDLFRLLWSHRGPVSFEGKFVRLKDIAFNPRPARAGGPPIWTGGMQEPSLRRAARLGDGWLPWAVSPEDIVQGAARIRQLRKTKFPIAPMTPVDIGSTGSKRYVGVLGENHHVMTGSIGEISNELEQYRSAGADHMILSFRDIRLFKDQTIGRIDGQMRLFAKDVLHSFK